MTKGPTVVTTAAYLKTNRGARSYVMQLLNPSTMLALLTIHWLAWAIVTQVSVTR
jgi:hypothetical protein